MTMPAWHVHTSTLLLLDELQRVGFEQLRFARSRSTGHVRIQLYAAKLANGPDWIVEPTGLHLFISDIEGQFMHLQSPQGHRDDAPLARKWTDLLSGPMKPQHLAGEVILDFPELLRPAYGPDHEYRQWFRHLRPHLHQGRLPLTFDEDFSTYGNGWDPHTSCAVTDSHGQETLLPAPPANTFIQAR